MPTVLEKAANGNVKAMQNIYESCRQKIFYFSQALLNDRDQAEKVTADVFCKVMEELPEKRFVSEEEFEKHIMLLTAKMCSRAVFGRDKKPVRLGALPSAEYPKEQRGFDGNLRLSWNFFELAVKEMDNDQRFVMIMFMAGMEIEDISAVMGMKEKNAEVYLGQVSYQLHKKLCLLREEGRAGVPAFEELVSLFAQRTEKYGIPPAVDLKVYPAIEKLAEPGRNPTTVVLLTIIIMIMVVVAGVVLISRNGDVSSAVAEESNEVSVSLSEEYQGE